MGPDWPGDFRPKIGEIVLMVIAFFIPVISFLMNAITILVIIDTFMSYFLNPYHPAREFVDRLVNPMLNPLRRVIPPLQSLDFSPFVLILIVQILGTIVLNFLYRLR